MLTLLEDVVRRDHLLPEFERTKDLLSLPESSEQDFFDLEHVPVLPWIPCTIAALALRLLELDCSIFYVEPEQPESHGDHLTGEDMVSVHLEYAVEARLYCQAGHHQY